MVSLTVAVPSFNRGSELEPLLREIKRQAKVGDQLLVCDDGSQDNTDEVVRKVGGFELFLQEKNRGMVANWNECLSASSRDWICLVHDDDFLAPGGLDALRRACAAVGEPSLIAHRSAEEDNNDSTFRYRFSEPGSWAVLHCPTIPSGAVVHRSIVQEIGGFDPRLKYSADLEYFPRICARYPLLIIENPRVISWKIHGGSYHFRTWMEADFFEQLSFIYREVFEYAKVTPEAIETALERKINATEDYMYAEACHTKHRLLIRHLSRKILRRRNLSGRRRLKMTWSALTGTQLPTVVR